MAVFANEEGTKIDRSCLSNPSGAGAALVTLS